MSRFEDINLLDEDGYDVAVQHPLPTDGDSVYFKDIDVANSDIGDFSGIVTDFFDDLKSVSSNATSDNPKILKIWFKRSIATHAIGFGCDNLAKSFSNIKIKALGSGEEVRYTKDDSADSTKRNSYLLKMPTLALNGVQIEFHTADEICLSNLIIFKSIDVHSTLSASQDDGDVVDLTATNSGNLKVANVESGLSIAKGDVVKTSNMSKFGQNSDIGTGAYEDIWDAGGTYIYPADGTAPIVKLIGHDAADTEPIEVQGLDITGALVIQTKTLTGLTAVTLDTPLWRVFRLRNVGTSDLVDDVCAIDTGDTVDYACINNGNNQTLMALYTIPLGYTAYLQQGTNSMTGLVQAYSISGRMWMREHGKVFQLKRTFGLSSTGTSYMIMPFPVPQAIPALTDIRVDAISSKAGGGLNTTFELILVAD